MFTCVDLWAMQPVKGMNSTFFEIAGPRTGFYQVGKVTLQVPCLRNPFQPSQTIHLKSAPHTCSLAFCS